MFGLSLLLTTLLALPVAAEDSIRTERLDEVVVTSASARQRIQNVQTGAEVLQLENLTSMPQLFGEADIMRSIQLLPGVKAESDASSSFQVRGGTAAQNQVLFDLAPVYNVGHLAGLFSAFNDDALAAATLYKGLLPAQYGGASSAVLDITGKSGDKQSWHGGGSIGLLSSKGVVEGPLVKDKASMLFSARRSYMDLLLQASKDFRDNKLYFYDVNAKLQHRFKNNDRLSASFYMGDDVIYIRYKTDENYPLPEGGSERQQAKLGLRWTSGNIMAKLQYDHRLRENLSMQTHIHFLRFGYNLSEQMNATVTSDESGKSSLDQTFDYKSKLIDVAAHTDWLYDNEQHSVHFGAGYEMHMFRPQIGNLMFAEMGISELNFDTLYTSGTTFGHEAYVYAEDTYKPVNWFTLNYGLRASLYGIKDKVYPSVEPRIGMRFLLHKDVALKASYSYMSQYVHLLSNTSISSPTDLWVPVTADIPPMRSMQVAAGLSYNILQQAELSVEGYYKRSTNLVEYKEGASFFGLSGSGWEDKVAVGDGWSYGVELLLQRKIGPVTGWIGYTWSRTMRQFDREGMVINNGKPYHAKYDREHDLSITLQYRITPKFEIAGTFVYGTGSRATLAMQRYFEPQEQDWVDYISERNNFKMQR